MPPRFASSDLSPFHRRLCDGDRTASDEIADPPASPIREDLTAVFTGR